MYRELLLQFSEEKSPTSQDFLPKQSRFSRRICNTGRANYVTVLAPLVIIWFLLLALINYKQFVQEKPLAPPESEIDVTAVNSVTTEASPATGGFPEFPTKDLNRRIAVATTLAAVGLFLSRRLEFGGMTLKDVYAAALPYEEVCFTCV